LRTDEDNDDSQFEKRLSKKYYDKLFKEYCLADLSRYKHGQIGLRYLNPHLFLFSPPSNSSLSSHFPLPPSLLFPLISIRWRTEKEVFTGKGHFVCGNKKCDERNNLNSYELPFAYLLYLVSPLSFFLFLFSF